MKKIPAKRSILGERSALEWCRMWAVVLQDPIGWNRGDGIDVEHLLCYTDFHDRLMDSTCKYNKNTLPTPKG